MNSWRDTILNDFVPNVSKLTLVADPDCLLTEEKLALKLRERGFDLIEFNDPIEFRYAYESKYRLIWDQGEHTDLVVILRLQNTELDSLPYDLLGAGRKLSFNMGDLFPNMSYPVIEQLDRSLLDSLFEAQCKSLPDRMGNNATKDYILRHVFGIAAELIVNDVELLRTLLRLHYGNLQLPLMLSERLIHVLKDHQGFKDWPLSEIIPDAEAFSISCRNAGRSLFPDRAKRIWCRKKHQDMVSSIRVWSACHLTIKTSRSTLTTCSWKETHSYRSPRL